MQQCSSPTDKILIYSVWDDGDNKVQLVDKGDGVVVQPFGGEGTGLKATLGLSWCNGEDVQFTVTTKRMADSTFNISCDVVYRGSTIHIATYNRGGVYPMQLFQAFLEDYNRSDDATGMLVPRVAKYFEPWCEIDGQRSDVTNANVSKVTTGLDAAGITRCIGGVDEDGDFFLHTGNPEELKCVCSYNTNFKKICFGTTKA